MSSEVGIGIGPDDVEILFQSDNSNLVVVLTEEHLGESYITTSMKDGASNKREVNENDRFILKMSLYSGNEEKGNLKRINFVKDGVELVNTNFVYVP